MTVQRSLQLEQQIVEEACRTAADPSRIIEHARHRSITLSGEYVADPMLIAEGRKRRKDMREELADCLNHGLFEWQTHPDDPENRELLEVIALIARAYNKLLPS